MFSKKATMAIIAGIILALCFVASCSLSEEERALLEKAADQKLQEAVKIFKTNGIVAAGVYCEKDQTIKVGDENYTIFCTVVANLYKPEEDVVKVSGNNTILPVSIFMRINGSAKKYLDDGHLYRDVAISAFARQENTFNTVVTKQKEFK